MTLLLAAGFVYCRRVDWMDENGMNDRSQLVFVSHTRRGMIIRYTTPNNNSYSC